MIAIEFDRPKMRRFFVKFLLIFFGVTGTVVLAVALLEPYTATPQWLGWLVLLFAVAVFAQVVVFLEHAGTLGRGLAKKASAVIINSSGVVDNASRLAPGQLAWVEIERMYPYEVKTHLIAAQWKKIPVTTRQRGVAILLKDSADLRHLLVAKPWLIRLLQKEWYRSRKRRWLFIPEMVLPVTAHDLMRQINTFYVAEVRGY